MTLVLKRTKPLEEHPLTMKSVTNIDHADAVRVEFVARGSFDFDDNNSNDDDNSSCSTTVVVVELDKHHLAATRNSVKRNENSNHTNSTAACSEASSSEESLELSSIGTTVHSNTCTTEPFQVEPTSSHATYRDEMVNAILQELSDDEREMAARVSFQYTQQQTSSQQQRQQEVYARQMIQRHISNDSKTSDTKTTVKGALRKVRNTLRFYQDKNIHETIRTIFDHTTSQNKEEGTQQQALTHYLGPEGKMFVRGYDRQGHACLHVIARNSPPGTHQDREGAMLAFLYSLERAIACSENHQARKHNCNDGMIVGCIDLKGFQLWHIPPLVVLVEMVLLLKDMYRDRVFCIYLVDAPLLARYMWNLLQPFIYYKLKNKCVFVTGQAEREHVFGAGNFDLDQCMPYQHPGGKRTKPMDMDKYLRQRRFDQAYNE